MVLKSQLFLICKKNFVKSFTIRYKWWLNESEIRKFRQNRGNFRIRYQYSPEGEFWYPISISYFNILFWYIPVTKGKIRENNAILLDLRNFGEIFRETYAFWRKLIFTLIWRKICNLVSKICTILFLSSM